jgi:hypothetical protein
LYTYSIAVSFSSFLTSFLFLESIYVCTFYLLILGPALVDLSVCDKIHDDFNACVAVLDWVRPITTTCTDVLSLSFFLGCREAIGYRHFRSNSHWFIYVE